MSDQAQSTWTNILTNGRATIWTAFAKGSGNDLVTVTDTCNPLGSPADALSINEFTGVGSIGSLVHNDAINDPSCSSNCVKTNTINISVNNALVFEGFEDYNPTGGACPTITNGGSSQITIVTLPCLNGVAGSFSQGRSIYSPNRGIGINSFSMSANNWAEVGHELVELDPSGGAPSNLGTQTACFGNCGNPAVTLANTNSTHTVNFNSSIELFYAFQSNLNGQILNITANVAKTYSNGNSLVLGVYTIPICSPGQPPFTPICPAALQKSVTIQNPMKGSNPFTNLAIPVSTGQWVGFAFTATFQGMDLNDTNTQVSMNQATDGGGQLNPTISQSTVFSTVSKVGLWGFITGNTITGIPPSPNVGGTCAGFLDCILPNWVFSLCTNQTPQCQNASALLWAMILSIVSVFFVFKAGGNLMPGIRLPIGEIFLMAMLVWVFILSGLQLLFVWVPLFFFFVVSLLIGKKTGTFL